MRLVDLVIRGGHLSEQALITAVMTGDRPAHLDRCDLCAERAVELGRWLDAVKTTGVESAEAAFTPERLAAQQVQIMRRLEQLDEPARVIAFPSQTRLQRDSTGRRVAAGWLGVAAAAGLVLGVISGQVSARMGMHPVQVRTEQPVAPAVQPTVEAVVEPGAPIDASLLDMDLDSLNVPALAVADSMTPRATQVALNRSVK
ncbi:MAG TPA: hypothetical protein VJN96_05515 [Vicinamibacterales bacterium]|nr:hypothetical protein [Vicinamibacterales bacterium]